MRLGRLLLHQRALTLVDNVRYCKFGVYVGCTPSDLQWLASTRYARPYGALISYETARYRGYLKPFQVVLEVGRIQERW
jgi:hypothetical protein